MRLSTTLRLSAGSLAVGFALAASPAFAQDSEQDQEEQATLDETETPAPPTGNIVVSGSRIARPSLNSPVPLTSVSVGDLLETQGEISLGEALNDLPSLRTTFSQGNSTRFIGTAGLNLLDLRGLGTSRTLVLVNGRRHITSSAGDFLVDVNTIPTDLLERVDIITGGNSAVYGSDAVAGVVNFVLKRDFEGVAVRGQGGISEEGDRATRFISATYGKNFNDGRGNIAFAAEYAKSDPLFFRERDELTGAFSGRCQFNVVSDSQADEGPFGSDGITDLEPVCGVRNGSISDGGTIGGLGQGRFLRFAPNGDVFTDVPDQFLPFSGNVIGGTGSTLRNTGQLAAGLERYTFNLLTSYEVSDAFRPYFEAKYVNIEAEQEGQPSFIVGGPGFVGGSPIFCDNAFLTDSALGTLQSFGLCAAGRTNTQTIPISRFNVDFGGRGEIQTRETYRFVAGVEGTFNDDWSYDLSVNYGRFDATLNSLNNLVLNDLDGNLDGFNLAADAVLDSSGNPACRVNTDADATNDSPACVPINLFGFGAPSQEALAFVNTTGMREETAEQFVILGSVTGDLSQLFELPGGPIGFAVGGEYRVETSFSAFDELTASGGTFLNAIQPFDPPKFEVLEGFGEISLPLLADVPGFEELTVNAAGRVSDYNTAVGTVFAYNVNAIWAPISDIRFRAGYAESVRAPTPSDLFSPQSQNFAFIGDPCDQDTGAINNNPNRAANCAAAGVPTVANAALAAACAGTAFPITAGQPYTNCTARTFSTGFTSGGNPTLTEEKGKSLTIGAVLAPRWTPGLTLTIDYYNIEIDDQIAVLGAQTIINNCYDAQTLDNPFCATVARDPNTGLFTDNAVISGGVNFASRQTEGIDFDLQYNQTFDNGHRLSARAIATRLLRLTFFEDPTDPTNPNRIRSELGDPTWAASFNATYDIGDFAFTWSARFLGPQTRSAFENQNVSRDICPGTGVTGASLTPCTPGELADIEPLNADQFDEPYIDSYLYNNFRVTYNIEDQYRFFIGVDNAFNIAPPFGQLGTGGGDPYDTFGRYYYAGFNIEL